MASAQTVGLYLDSGCVYVLNAKASGSDVRIQGYGFSHFSTPEGAGEADKNTILRQELGKAFTQASVKSKNISLCVPGDASMTRYFEIPNLPKKEEKNAVRFEAQKYVPFDMKDLYHGYEAYPDTQRKKTGIVFLAAKKQWVDAACAMIAEAGYKVVSAELMSQAIAKTYFYESSKDNNSIQVLIAANDEKTAELIITRGMAVFVTRHLTLTTGPEATHWDAPMLVSEIRLSFDYFAENFRNLNISKICLLMEREEQAQKLEELLRKEFSIAVEINPLLSALQNEGVSVSQRAATYGLALTKAGSINLISADTMAASAPTMSWVDEKKHLQDLATKAIIGVAILLGVVSLALNQFVSSKNAQLVRMASTYPPANNISIADPLPQLREKEAALLGRLAFSMNFYDKKQYTTQMLNELPRMIPANVLLTRFAYSSEITGTGSSEASLKLEGYVLTAEPGSELSYVNKMVQQFKENKEFMSSFTDIKVNSTKRVTYKDLPVTRFSLECTPLRKT